VGQIPPAASSKERGKIGYRTRRLEKDFRTNYFRVASPNALLPRLDKLFQLHQMRWERRNEPGSFSVLERRKFYLKIATEFLRNGWLEFWFLELNDVQVAAQFAFAYRNMAYSLQEGFDPNYSSRSVGYILRSHVIRRLIELGMRKYDFLGGEDDSKLRWGGERSQYLDIHMAASFSRAGAFLMCRTRILACKKLIRTHISSNCFHYFQILFHAKRHKAIINSQEDEGLSTSAQHRAQLQPARLSLWS
jgi:CelD/BcsL family acetyltransferase involved in cellulose biosynthesis